jgi:hypothetical protein
MSLPPNRKGSASPYCSRYELSTLLYDILPLQKILRVPLERGPVQRRSQSRYRLLHLPELLSAPNAIVGSQGPGVGFNTRIAVPLRLL